MRLIHTSDWHLGHTLHNFCREAEHDAFLDWLLDTIDENTVDALLIAGDIFETANPRATAQTAWFDFLAAARKRCPDLDIVVIGGNHDSAMRLDAPRPVLKAMRIQVVGGLPLKAETQEMDAEAMVFPLHDASGAVAAHVAAVPFLRIGDLPRLQVDGNMDAVVEGVRAIYTQVLDVARLRCDAGQALLAMGHCYAAGATLTERSERRVLGNQHAIPADIFAEDIAYTALGHIHLAEQVGGASVQYCGSPIPLSLAERTYPHQVLLVELDGEALSSVTPLHVPRLVEMIRVPEDGAMSPDEAIAALEALPKAEDTEDRALWPLLEVRIGLASPDPGLKGRVEVALEDRRVRLARFSVEQAGTGKALGDVQAVPLQQLSEAAVFKLAWAQKYPKDPSAEVLEAFHELVDRVNQEAP